MVTGAIIHTYPGFPRSRELGICQNIFLFFFYFKGLPLSVTVNQKNRALKKCNVGEFLDVLLSYVKNLSRGNFKWLNSCEKR